MSLRDEIRAATVGAQKLFRREKVRVADQDIFVRQPTVGERHKIADASLDTVNGELRYNTARNRVMFIIALCEDAEGKHIFEDGDVENLLGQPTGGWFDKLIEAIELVCNVSQEAQKNSEATKDGETSSL